MNRDDARDKLIDLLYGELDEPDRRELEALLAQDPELREEYARLRRGRSAMAAYRAGEPKNVPTVPPAESGGQAPVAQEKRGQAPPRETASRSGASPLFSVPAAASTAPAAVPAASSAAPVTPDERRRLRLRMFRSRRAPLMTALAAAAVLAVSLFFLFEPGVPLDDGGGIEIAQSPREDEGIEKARGVEEDLAARQPAGGPIDARTRDTEAFDAVAAAPPQGRPERQERGRATVRKGASEPAPAAPGAPSGDSAAADRGRGAFGTLLGGSVAYADEPPTIERETVALTIMSQPDLRDQAWRFGQWRGASLVRDRRVIRELPAGVSDVRFTGVPSGIVPDSVRLRSLDDPRGLTVLEQNYQYDLASTDAILQKYVDRPIGVTFQDGTAIAGTLLSWDGRTLVVQPEGAGPRSVSREQVRAVRFATLPQGLLTQPTLLWQLRNDAQRVQRFEVAYLTKGLTWRADYVLKLTVENGDRHLRGQQHPAAEPVPNFEILDTADLVGFATVTNESGVTFPDAQLKLLAGDVNLILEDWFERTTTSRAWVFEKGAEERKALALADGPQFVEKYFFEYHLYTLQRPTTLRDRETKQIEMVRGSGIPVKRAYVYDRTQHPSAVRVVSEFKNSEENGLGKPLPKGVVRLYVPDPTGQTEYVSQTEIDHTPVDEKIRLPWSYAFDITVHARITANRRSGSSGGETWEYRVRNDKDYPVTVTAIVHVPKSTRVFESERPWHMREVGVIEIDIPVGANSQTVAEFSYDWDTANGGGLSGDER